MELFAYDALLVTNGRTPMPGAPVRFYDINDINRTAPLEVFTLTGESLGKEPRTDALGDVNRAYVGTRPVRVAFYQSGGYPPKTI